MEKKRLCAAGERLPQWCPLHDHTQTPMAAFRFIEGRNKPCRRHSILGWGAPPNLAKKHVE